MKNVMQMATEEFLKMKGVCHSSTQLASSYRCTGQTHTWYHPNYKSNYTFLKKVDQLPTGPKWTCKIIQTVGELLGKDNAPIIEEHELWNHDPIECVHELIGNPTFQEYMAYAPEKAYADKNGQKQ